MTPRFTRAPEPRRVWLFLLYTLGFASLNYVVTPDTLGVAIINGLTVALGLVLFRMLYLRWSKVRRR